MSITSHCIQTRNFNVSRETIYKIIKKLKILLWLLGLIKIKFDIYNPILAM
jgi:hypothetical protein